MKKILFPVIVLLSLSILLYSFMWPGVSVFTEKWYSTSAATTTKIKLVTGLHGKDPMRAALSVIVKTRFIVDTGSLNPMITLPKNIGGKRFKYRFDFVSDSIIILSGQVAKSSSLSPIAPNPGEKWMPIEKTYSGYGSRGYEIMTVFASGIKYKAILYNR